MDIAALRLGFAHHALRRALGDELSPISFAQGSFAFIDRSNGTRFFCSADNSALSILALRADGALAGADDEAAQSVATALRLRAEPDYLANWGAFARDFDGANSTEARAAARFSPSSSAVSDVLSDQVELQKNSTSHRTDLAPASAPASLLPSRPARAPAPSHVPLMDQSLPNPEPIAVPAARFTRAPRKQPMG